MNKKTSLFLKIASFSLVTSSSLLILSCSQTQEDNKTLVNNNKTDSTNTIQNQANVGVLSSISSNASNNPTKSIFWIETNAKLDTNKSWVINLDNQDIELKISKSAINNAYFGTTKALENRKYAFNYIKSENQVFKLPNQQTLQIQILPPVIFHDPKLDFVEAKEPIWDTLKADTSQVRVQNYSIEELKSSAQYQELFKLKKLKNWSAPYFAKYIQEHNLNKLSYENEAKNVKFIAPFNTKAKKSNVMYQLTVYSFADGNNDGIGDFIGLKDKLEYFSNLGIDTLYL